MNNFFSHCRTLDELKAEYRRLAKIHHPDAGGDTETMKQVNAQYEAAFNLLNSSSAQPKEETASEFIHVIDTLMRLDGITVELCGSWLWISGKTKAVKEDLKAAGCRWASKKAMWYWRPAGQTVRSRKPVSMENIRGKYGSRVLSGAGYKDCNLCTV